MKAFRVALLAIVAVTQAAYAHTVPWDGGPEDQDHGAAPPMMPPLECGPWDGYDMYKFADHWFDDIVRVDEAKGPDKYLALEVVEAAAKACDGTPECVAFNSEGYLKYAISPIAPGVNCFYVKKTGSEALAHCPVAYGFGAYVDADHEGDTIDTTDRFVGNDDRFVELVAEKCRFDEACVGFTSAGEFKSKVLPMQRSVGKCLYLKNDIPHCPHVTGYDVEAGKDHPGDDISYGSFSSDIESIVYEAAAACSSEPECAGFNTDGWIKRVVAPTTDDSSYCLYTKGAYSGYGTPGGYGGYGGYGMA